MINISYLILLCGIILSKVLQISSYRSLLPRLSHSPESLKQTTSYQHRYKLHSSNYKQSSHLNLWKLSDPITERYKDNQWDFHLLELSELLEATEIMSEGFYKPRLTIDTSDMTGVELKIWSTVLKIYLWFDMLDFKISNYLGFRTRSGKRLKSPSLSLSEDSFILVVTPISSKEIAGLVEICLEKPVGELAPPIRPLIRPTANLRKLEPYLCNLCVKVKYRRRKLAKILCQLSEDIVQSYWGKYEMYLHVEKNNIAATKLYEGMGYDITSMTLPQWKIKLLGLDELYYFKRKLNDVTTFADEL